MKAHLILDVVGLLLPDPAVHGVSPAVALAVRRLGVRRHGVVRGGILGKYKDMLVDVVIWE